ncbi:hypothetical protein OH77DRAFT_1419619 [Trametes cingulata]|nr:hypothetical protein OH77DRAFT_1419619 [Trametes cingulata]
MAVTSNDQPVFHSEYLLYTVFLILWSPFPLLLGSEPQQIMIRAARTPPVRRPCN